MSRLRLITRPRGHTEFVVVNGPDGWVISDAESSHHSLGMFAAQYKKLRRLPIIDWRKRVNRPRAGSGGFQRLLLRRGKR
jgi:hypothetical protein